jgi:hypothetical protein
VAGSIRRTKPKPSYVRVKALSGRIIALEQRQAETDASLQIALARAAELEVTVARLLGQMAIGGGG